MVFLNSEPTTRNFLQKKLFLKVCQYSRGTPILEPFFNKTAVFFNKTAALKACNFIKKRLWCFPVNPVKFLRTPILIITSVNGCFCELHRESHYFEHLDPNFIIECTLGDILQKQPRRCSLNLKTRRLVL